MSGDSRMEVDEKAEEQIWEDSNRLIFTPLGSGREVGRSCHILKFKGKTIMLDCGIHPGRTGENMLPFLDTIEDMSSIDLLLITHFHLDHAASLPHLTERRNFKGRILMSSATKAVLRLVLKDFARILANDPVNPPLFTQNDLNKCLEKCETIHFHTLVETQGIKLTAYHAGHVLGAAMFLIEIAGVRILYTGDYSREDDRHLRGAEIPSVRPDLLVVESTFGLMVHESREQRENRFTESVEKIVRRGGNCLIPMGALGAVQELLLILEDHWNKNPDLKGIPIYHTSRIANEALSVYRHYINTMNDEMRSKQLQNPWTFENIGSLGENEEIVGPAVVLASPGYLQCGKSRKLFEQWCSERRNGVILAGYSVDGTLAKTLSKEGAVQEVESLNGTILSVECEIKTISFAAHADFIGTKSFVDQLKPKNIIFVHGEEEQMRKLKNELQRNAKQHSLECEFFNPENCKSVTLEFQEQRIVKAYGGERFQNFMRTDGTRISAYLVRTNFTDQLVSTEDLRYYTELSTATVNQKLHLPFNSEFARLETCVGRLFSPVSTPERNSLVINGKIELILKNSLVEMSWDASPTNDMIADALTAIIMQANGGIPAVRVGTCCSAHSHGNPHENLMLDAPENIASTTMEQIVEKSRSAALLLRLLKERFADVRVEQKSIDVFANDQHVSVYLDESGHTTGIQGHLEQQPTMGDENEEEAAPPNLVALQAAIMEIDMFARQTL
eukprot:CAMPEP_0203756158 /NCGR_PEP_ID=MMETSP0098-20131031/9477_1 /ASSEMBLY_ACC=CAM_ASM_000208 /TAXON_ID=96639 /ORGANISM=" , Strain NY0313808BC1" /LENGTH=730 /DNA_ID=CAMNT_0050647917 /DNA_START=150 /DNA_END=2339 /DNA_ORIENTATION=+